MRVTFACANTSNQSGSGQAAQDGRGAARAVDSSRDNPPSIAGTLASWIEPRVTHALALRIAHNAQLPRPPACNVSTPDAAVLMCLASFLIPWLLEHSLQHDLDRIMQCGSCSKGSVAALCSETLTHDGWIQG